MSVGLEIRVQAAGRLVADWVMLLRNHRWASGVFLFLVWGDLQVD